MIRWSNVPIPEASVLAAIAGGLTHLLAPRSLAPGSAALPLIGLALLLLGVAMVVWSVTAAGNSDLGHPEELTTTGPFAFSRNPMYVGWTALCLGLALLLNSLWMAIGVGVAWLFTHLITIPREERFLSARFGVEYEAFRKRVRRYL